MDLVARLSAALAELDIESPVPPQGGRIGAALALLREVDDDLEIVYTRRHDDLRSHPGQVSFPGGRVDEGEGIVEAALREAAEEVALDPATVTPIGRLNAFYIPPSRFWLEVVLARWDAPHPLHPAEAEVDRILHVRVSHLLDPASWRAVRLSVRGWSWAWDLGDGELLWGATGVATVMLLALLDPDWTKGVEPWDLPADRIVEPWRPGSAADPPAPVAPPAAQRQEHPR